MPIGNALVGGVLRSPLHRTMSRSLLLLTYKGRRTGKEYTIPVGYARYADDELVVIAGRPGGKTWWTNMRGVTAGTGSPGRQGTRGRGPPGHRGRRRAPPRRLLRAGPRAARAFGIEAGPGGKVAPERLSAAAGEVQVVAVRLKR